MRLFDNLDPQHRRFEWIRGFSARAAWILVVGSEDATLLDGLLDGQRKVLIVQPNPFHVERIRDQLSIDDRDDLQISQALIGPEPGEVDWFQYNDSRFDGIVALPLLKFCYPNLELVSQEPHHVETLDIIAQTVWGCDSFPEGEGLLLVFGRDLEPILQGATSLLERVNAVLWQPPAVPAGNPAGIDYPPAADVPPALQAHSYVPLSACPEGMSVWVLDRQAITTGLLARNDGELKGLQAIRQELTARVAELEGQRNALVAERDDHKAGRLELTARCGELQAQCLRLGGEVVRLEGEKESLQAQLDKLLEEAKGWQRKQAELIRCAELSESQLATVKDLFVQIQRGSPADPVERAKRKQRKARGDNE